MLIGLISGHKKLCWDVVEILQGGSREFQRFQSWWCWFLGADGLENASKEIWTVAFSSARFLRHLWELQRSNGGGSYFQWLSGKKWEYVQEGEVDKKVYVTWRESILLRGKELNGWRGKHGGDLEDPPEDTWESWGGSFPSDRPAAGLGYFGGLSSGH